MMLGVELVWPVRGKDGGGKRSVRAFPARPGREVCARSPSGVENKNRPGQKGGFSDPSQDKSPKT